MPEEKDTLDNETVKDTVVTNNTDTVVSLPVDKPATSLEAPAIPTLGRLNPGDVVGDKYEILSFLGKGGMCTVYKARHLLLGRDVALKMLHEKLVVDKEAIQRFQREAVAISALKHPNIVEVYGFGVYQAVPFMAMEFLEGKSLDQLLKEKIRLSREEALPIFTQILDALAHAHENGIIHRDLKPSNIMLLADRVKLVDFGIAKILPESGRELQKLTQTGDVFGTVLYMSPEQCRAEAMDARSDLYSLGCLMYEVLDGAPPLQGQSPYETIAKHLNEYPRKSDYLIDDFGQQVLSALEKQPAKRPASAKELKAALVKSAVGVADEAKCKVKSNNLAASSAVLLVVVLLPIFFYIFAYAPYNSTSGSAVKTSPPSKVQKEDKRLLGYKRALSKAEKDYGSDSAEVAKRLHDIASYLHLDQRKYAEAEPLWKRLLAIREKVLKESPSDTNLLNVATSLQELAQCYFEQGKHTEAEPLWKRSLSIREQILSPDDPVIASSFSALATNYSKQGRYKDAEPMARQGLALFEKKFGTNDRHVLASLFILAECCQKQGKYAEAEQLLRRARNQQSGGVK